jgi:hypothetical protein
MRERSERLRGPWSSIDHVLLPSSEERQHQLDALLAAHDDRGTSENNNDEPGSWLQSGETTTHGKASFAIDDVSSFLPSFLPSFVLFSLCA